MRGSEISNMPFWPFTLVTETYTLCLCVRKNLSIFNFKSFGLLVSTNGKIMDPSLNEYNIHVKSRYNLSWGCGDRLYWAVCMTVPQITNGDPPPIRFNHDLRQRRSKHHLQY